MKRLYIFILFIIHIGYVRSQDDIKLNLPHYDLKPYHFGFALGLNRMDFDLKPNLSMADSIIVASDSRGFGFNFGVVANLRLNNFIDLRFIPEISFDSQSLIFFSNTFVKETYSFKTTCLNFPLLLKIKYKRIRNFRPYIILGCKYQLDLKRKQFPFSVNPLIRIENYDYCVEFGAGFDKYLPYFRFSPELVFSLGIQNLNQKNNTFYSRSIDKLTSRTIKLYLYFE